MGKGAKVGFRKHKTKKEQGKSMVRGPAQIAQDRASRKKTPISKGNATKNRWEKRGKRKKKKREKSGFFVQQQAHTGVNGRT